VNKSSRLQRTQHLLFLRELTSGTSRIEFIVQIIIGDLKALHFVLGHIVSFDYLLDRSVPGLQTLSRRTGSRRYDDI